MLVLSLATNTLGVEFRANNPPGLPRFLEIEEKHKTPQQMAFLLLEPQLIILLELEEETLI